MNNFIAFLSIFFISMVGYTVIRGFQLLPKEKKLLTLACSYGLGVGLLSMQMYLYARLDIPWQKPILLFPWIILIVIFLIKNKYKPRFSVIKLPKLDKLELA